MKCDGGCGRFFGNREQMEMCAALDRAQAGMNAAIDRTFAALRGK